jgi:hypothetical protein
MIRLMMNLFNLDFQWLLVLFENILDHETVQNKLLNHMLYKIILADVFIAY